MKIIELIDKDQFFISCEIIPPKKGFSLDKILKTVEHFANIDVKFISVTKHQPKIKYIEKENSIKKIIFTTNPGTVGLAAAIKSRFDIEPIPHVICGGNNKFEIEDILIDLDYIGIENIFVIRGDPVNGKNTFIPEKYGYQFAYQLVEHIKRLNNGIYTGDVISKIDNTENTVIPYHKTNFCIGVAGYPEMHYESLNIHDDFNNLINKINAGADYIITQIFYDPNVYINFVNRLRKYKINIPVIPGIKPIIKYKSLRKLVSTFKIKIPQKLVKLLENAKSESEEEKAGIKYIHNMIEKLMDFGIPGLHFFTMGSTDTSIEFIKQFSASRRYV